MRKIVAYVSPILFFVLYHRNLSYAHQHSHLGVVQLVFCFVICVALSRTLAGMRITDVLCLCNFGASSFRNMSYAY